MSIYIVAHGTVNGYQKISSTIVGGGSELSVLTDIRTEFDNTNTMLTKMPGYLLQMSPTGVWISVAKPFIDGERSGNGAGFFAFSVFIPTGLLVDGKKIKEILDSLMDTYLNMCPGFMTRNINVDWSFVEAKAKELSGYATERLKNVNIDYIQSNKFAYVEVENDERVIQFLDKPFQPEFGQFKAVFIGTHLQHPMRLTMHEKIDIDFENELYDILWTEDVSAWPNLERKVRKKEIETKSRFFEKKYYHSKEVKFSEGIRDDNNTTLTLETPKLEPEINELKLIYNYPEAVKSIRVNGQNREDKNKLSFKGEEFAKTIKISLDLSVGYKCKEFSIIPSECTDKTYNVDGIIKMKKVNICVVWEDLKICDAIKYRDIEFKQNATGYTVEHKSERDGVFYVSIPENEDFVQNYKVSLTNPHYQTCSLSEMGDGDYSLIIKRRQQPNNNNFPTVVENRKEKFYIETKIDISKIDVNNGSIDIKRSNGNCYIEISKGIDINAIYFRLKSNNKKLKVEINGDEITLTRPFLFDFDFYLDRKNILVGIVILGVTIVLSVAALLVLDWANIVDVKFPWKKGNDRIEQNPPQPDTQPFDIERVIHELDSVLESQRKSWIYKEIKLWVDKYKDNDQVEKLDSYKELSWLMKSRLCFDGYYMDGDSLTAYQVASQHKERQLTGGWAYDLKALASKAPSNSGEIATFLKTIIDAGDPTYKQFFNKYITKEKTKEKTLTEVKMLWAIFFQNSNNQSQQQPVVSQHQKTQEGDIP